LTMIPGVKLVLSCDPDANPADIVGYESKIARRERTRSQIVIIDTPPALVANDATELMHTADSIVLVARCGSTSVASARRVGDLIARLRAPVVGVVLVGTPDTSTSDARYYHKRPSRRRVTEHQRPPIAPTVGSAATPPPPPRFEVPEETVSSTARSAPASHADPVDHGGIWRRPHETIDLSSGGNLPARTSLLPEVVPPRAPRATVGDGYPSRDALDSNAPIPRPDDDEHAATSGQARGRLPLFRAGDNGGNGNGNGRNR
jgi:hypothetical protein